LWLNEIGSFRIAAPRVLEARAKPPAFCRSNGSAGRRELKEPKNASDAAAEEFQNRAPPFIARTRLQAAAGRINRSYRQLPEPIGHSVIQ
jgi:hypothetical protein